MYDSSPEITRCNINGNHAYYDGGGIICSDSSPMVEDCEISGNWNIICGNGAGVCLHNSNAVFIGCRITGNTTMQNGGGIYCSTRSATFIDCIISGNTAEEVGGGIVLEESGSIFENCEISENSAPMAAGVSCAASSAQFENCTISNNIPEFEAYECMYFHFSSGVIINNCIISENTGPGISCYHSDLAITNCSISGNTGSGITCWGQSSPTITGCLINGNSNEYHGGGIAISSGSNPQIQNCTITGNTASYYGGGIWCDNSDPSGVNNIIWANIAPEGSQIYISGGQFGCTFSDIQGGWEGEGNIDADPLFYSTTGDSAYFLTAGSPCIDAGDPDSSLDPDSTRADMGAYYYHHTTGIEDFPANQIPERFALHNARPNPFNAQTTIPFTLHSAGQVCIDIFDITGRLVGVQYIEPLQAGYHEYNWNAEGMASGVYLVRLEQQSAETLLHSVQKAVLVK